MCRFEPQSLVSHWSAGGVPHLLHQGVVESLDRIIESSKDPFLQRFRSLLSLDPSDPVTQASEAFYLHMLSSIQAAHGRAPAALIEDIKASTSKTVNVKVTIP